MIASGSWLELVLVIVTVLATGGLVVLGVVVVVLRKRPSWRLYWISVAVAVGLIVLNALWNV